MIYLGAPSSSGWRKWSIPCNVDGAVAADEQAKALFGDHPIVPAGLCVRLADALRMAEDVDGMRTWPLRS